LIVRCSQSNAPINQQLYQIPLDTANPAAKAGPIASRLLEEIMAIQYGEVPNHPWSVVVD